MADGELARRTDTSDPHRSRDRALKILFQADLRGEPIADALARVEAAPDALAMLDDLDPTWVTDPEPGTGPAEAARPGRGRRGAVLDDFTRRLVTGVATHLADLDAHIGRHARRWTVSRMPVVDRNVLRLATFELTHCDTAHAIVIDEALTLAKSLSTSASGRYINGVLESVRRSLVDG